MINIHYWYTFIVVIFYPFFQVTCFISCSAVMIRWSFQRWLLRYYPFVHYFIAFFVHAFLRERIHKSAWYVIIWKLQLSSLGCDHFNKLQLSWIGRTFFCYPRQGLDIYCLLFLWSVLFVFCNRLNKNKTKQNKTKQNNNKKTKTKKQNKTKQNKTKQNKKKCLDAPPPPAPNFENWEKSFYLTKVYCT